MERLCIYLTNLGRYNEGCLMGEWVKLPLPEDKLETVLARIGIDDQYEEYFISDYESIFDNLYIGEYTSIDELNVFAEKLEELADFEYEKLAAVLESEACMTIAEVLQIIEDLDSFDLLAEVDDDTALGEYYADFGCIFHGVPDHIQRYFDFDSYGRDIRLELNCCFTSYGMVIDYR